MTQPNRVQDAGRINRSRPLTFTFNGRTFQGYEGDTVASALLANGIDIVGRSFKYARPRGIVAAGAEEPNAVLQLGASEAAQIPNVRATQQELYNGLECASTNGWPTVEFDVMAYLGKIGGGMMPPGFYNKTFMSPQSLWPTYEKYIRKAAGLGRASKQKDPDTYDHLNQHCDVLVVGGGAAGLAAALAAGEAGARVILADEQAEFGGALLHSNDWINEKPASNWVAETVARLRTMDNVQLLPYSTVNGYHDHNFLTIHQRQTDHLGETAPQGLTRQRLHRVRAGWVVLATGAHERPLVYANNDVPGCMIASAVSTYIRRYGVVPGNRLVVATTNDYAYQTAIDWANTGRQVVAVVDSRPDPDGELVAAAEKAGIRVIKGSVVYDVQGSKRVKSVSVARLSTTELSLAGSETTLDCDTVATSGGWSPVVHLSCHTGSRPVWDDDVIGFVPGPANQKQLLAGGIQGHYSIAECLAEGFSAGAQAATNAGFDKPTDLTVPKVHEPSVGKAMPLFYVPHKQPMTRAPKQFVDYQNDVTAASIDVATREGFEAIEHVKRYTALGFGTDQGKLGNINGMAITAQAVNKTIPETGTTVFRPNYTPVTFGAIAGRNARELFVPERYTAMHQWHVDNGAKFEDVGEWKRPWYYPKAGESMQDSLNREVLAVRNGVGMLDASTLGKIDIQGKDAREFLGRIYTNAWAKLAVGKCRYGLMCGEDGMVFDDGVTSCLGENHFLMTTTTGGAAHVLEWLELYHQTEWPELEVFFTSVTDHWATMTIGGPDSRKLLAELCDDIDLDKDAFKFMDWRQGTVAGVPARVFRISFTGELSYEINVQANFGMHVWKKLMEHGAKYGITPYGTETMHILRAEKGFIIVGQDTDSTLHPYDLGMGWAVAQQKPFSFVGKRGMSREDPTKANRKQLVGLLTKDPQKVLPEGAQAVADPKQAIPMTMLGHVTSSYYSATLGRSIAMGTIRGGLDRMGETVYYPMLDGSVVEAEICSPVFYDPKGDRQNV
ncbi:MAG: sarcosine oxidase subunit alpha [Oceanospirillaceae bacterium]|nr:sarcosine oxidase subunit alpha [Oceanospirillaceae bacterium]MBT11267.1 sarcosine oxidase subunit alpha [Oceanospirillaceae bacterium]|tara:strand:+ start:121117 stop:124140 length:3024 start_codon:yes stop_codon:yes gene_type:complete